MNILTVEVVPLAKFESVEQINATAYKVYVTAPSQKGKANKIMLRLLATKLGLRESQLILSRGDRTNKKTVIVMDGETL